MSKPEPRHVILQIDISLDGFVSGPQGELDWISATEAMNQDAHALLATADTVLLGRVAYEMFATFWPSAEIDPATTVGQIAQRLNLAEKIVFSRTLASVAWGRWNTIRLAQGSLSDEIKHAKTQPGAHMLLYAGAGTVASFIAQNLIDHYRLRVHPVLLGAGHTIFAGGAGTRALAHVKTTAYDNGVVSLDYVRPEAR
jgi:dihydrofolate reductase